MYVVHFLLMTAVDVTNGSVNSVPDLGNARHVLRVAAK